MKILAKYKTEKGGWAFVWCECCGQKKVFKSWGAAEEWFKERNIKNWKTILWQ